MFPDIFPAAGAMISWYDQAILMILSVNEWGGPEGG
jgi:hypothetical protein